MKLARRILLGAMAAVALVGCKDDPIAPAPVDDPSVAVTKGPGVYFALQIDLPNAKGARSVTDSATVNGSASNSGVEIGKDYENAVSEAIVVLANANANEFIAAAPVNAGDLTAQNATKDSYIAKSKFSKQELTNYYNNVLHKTDSVPLKANIFVFCNPTQGLRDKIFGQVTASGDTINAPEQGKNEWLEAVGSISDPNAGLVTSSIWSRNAFLMTNALIATRELPGTLQQWNTFTTSDKPFHLSAANDVVGVTGGINNGTAAGRGSIKVERACARFDFRDGSNNNFTYDALFIEENGIETKKPLVQVHLQKMFLVNQSNSFYYLPRTVAPVASDGSSIVGVTIDQLKAGVCKPEEPWFGNGMGGYMRPFGNYVADYNIAWKNQVYLDWGEDSLSSGKTPGTEFSKYFNYPFFNDEGTIDNTDIMGNRWSTYLCSDVVKGELNNTEGWTADSTDYKIWCYSTENTIPSVAGQINGISTGVVFKAKYSSPIKNYADTASTDFIKRNTAQVARAINDSTKVSAKDPVLYMFAKVVYCGWENVREAALEAADAQFEFVKTGERRDTLEDGTVILVPEGDWKLRSINRTNSLYKAVFGDGGVGKLTFTYTDDGDKNTYTATWPDPLPVDSLSANFAWNEWDKLGRHDDNILPDGEHMTDPTLVAAKNAYKRAVTEAGFTIYQRSYDGNFGYGYYCYYYYWNRHNDNGFNGIMGPMEFAVVRNNVYKLAVTKINNLGHPRISENDPHKPGPGTPDEDESVYMDVTSEVLPWVVRVNNIEF